MERAEGGHRAFLVLGSNIVPEVNLPAAVRMLGEHGRIAAVSHVWQSAPVGFVEQADFLNAALLLETSLSAEQLVRDVIPAIERHLGRKRDPRNKNAPRTIDVDLALYDADVRDVLTRTIPDPAILSHSFVACPLAELAPDYRHPVTGEPLRAIAARLAARPPGLRCRRDVDLAALRVAPS